MAGATGVTDEPPSDVINGCTVEVAGGVPVGAGGVATGVATGVTMEGETGGTQVASGINVVIAKRGG
ncbi:MAG: hypothetical protein Fur0043_08510 [Anaerolineales bacterium]